MILKQFKRAGPTTIFLIIVILFFLWTGPILRVRNSFTLYFDLEPMPLYGIVSSLIGTHPVPGIIVSISLVALMAFLMVNLNTALFFINERTFLPALFYILMSGMFPQYQLMNPAVMASVFLMLAIKRIMDSYRVQGVAYNFFDAGLLIGTGSLFYANLIWFSAIMIIGISILRTWNPREIFLSVIGLITPYLISSAVYYVAGYNPLELFDTLSDNLFGRRADFAFIPIIMVAILYTGLLSISAISHLFMMIGTKKIQSRKTFLLLTWVFLISVVIWFLIPSVSVEIMWIAAIPLSYFLSHYFVFMKRKVLADVLFGLFFMLIVVMQLWYLG
jgi:hypothetical protein